MIERLDMNNKYSAVETAIHLNRYTFIKKMCTGKKVLDISCGEGYGSYLISQWGAEQVVGIDISEETINKATKMFSSKNLSYQVSNAEDLKDIEDDRFDLVVSFETLEHLKKPENFLKEIKRVSKKDCIFVISCPNDHFYYTEKESNPFHEKKYTFDEFKKLTEKYLGKGKYLFGYATNGYCNCNSEETKKDIIQKDMINNTSEVQSLLLTTDSQLTSENCSYYIGVWGTQVISNNYTLYPINMNETVYKICKDKDRYIEELKEEIDQLTEELNGIIKCNIDEKKELDKKIRSLIINVRVLEIEKEEISKILSEKIEILEEEKNNIIDERNSIIEEQKNLQKEKEAYKEQINDILNSKSYIIARKISAIINKVIS